MRGSLRARPAPRIDPIDVAAHWEANAKTWSHQARTGLNV